MTHDCPLCGYSFTDAEMATRACPACHSRPGGCGLVKCPSCGYEWPPERASTLVRLVRWLFPGGGKR